MTNVRSISLFKWLPILSIGLMSTLWIISLIFSINNQKSKIVEQSINFIRLDLSALVREIQIDLNNQHPHLAREALASRAVNENYLTLFATDQNGSIIFSTRKSMIGKTANLVAKNFSLKSLQKAQQYRQIDIQFNPKEKLIFVYAPLQLNRSFGEIRSLQNGVIYLEYSLKHQFSEVIYQALKSSWFVGVLLTITILTIGLFVYIYIKKPTDYLLNVTEKLSFDEDSIRSEMLGNGEFAKLGKAFNDMADELINRFNAKQKAQQLANKNYLVLDSVFRAIPDLFFLMDKDLTIRDFKASKKSFLYVETYQFLNSRMNEVLPLEVAELFEKAASSLKKGNHITTFEYELEVQNGKRFFEARMSLLSENDQIVAVVRDITNRKAAEEKIIHQAHFDNLTDLPNRFLLIDRVTQLISDAKRQNNYVALLFLDLDDFKKVNDCLGHEIGDKMLIESAKRLSDCTRETDTVARLGGDEFIVLLSSIKEISDINPVAENILRSFTKPFNIHERELIVSCSIGIATYPMDGIEPSELLRNADSAMYHAKSQGRNCYSFYNDNMNRQISQRLAIEEQLHGALDRGELYVVYQPQFEISSHRLIGAEALIRWNNPALGNVSPSEFIPIAEQSGAISQIGEFVLKEALRSARGWSNNDNDSFRVAVNLSPRQFRNQDLISMIRQKIEKAGVEPKQLELEITEGVLLGAQDFVDETINEIHRLGSFIAMDDFGTGYSSLNYLRRYPFDILKIDQAFVADMTNSEGGAALIKAMVGMAHGLNMKVIAEGIETDDQLELLKEIGCDIGQGYLLGKPMLKEEFSKIIDKRYFSYAL